ncbi:MAG: beta-ketoacyl-[acyl-carrier-protein] synthase family protein [Burkholderiales bacterium]|nr:beta-ketoacyl-[acyl-carrier-protein] synthase family protein [Burkholderiales bacterium]MDE2296945.1 beta-ketoacyl-[acyl-carrier-protein] synthase family protein [Burkholderiales bacterium]MDE2626725.1 beta-ketoacyl-[acyl-carrier-protein] synthase family protein [Burkholderiales bacterium]
MTPLAISARTATTALGAGCAATLDALQAQRSGLAPVRFLDVPLPTWTGEVDAVDTVVLPAPLAEFDCRNNRLAWLGLQQDGFLDAVAAARARWGAGRVAVFLGTSTSGLLQTELAYRQRTPDGALPADFRYGPTHNTYSLAAFVSRALQLRGPGWVVSTACSSSAKVFGNAARLIAAGLIDAAVVGGVDSLCLTTLYGFNSLELLSSDICRPWDAARNGLSIGEAAAFALVERECAAPVGWLLGVGESNDGHHMSTPHPEGAGAIAAMRGALADAALQPADIDYINLHGTATPSNDAAEDFAVGSVFGLETPCSSTKGATGHTLGAAGAVEAVIALLAMRHGLLPAGLNLQRRDAALQLNYLRDNRRAPVRRVLSNSFGFGGSNASLVLGGAS